MRLILQLSCTGIRIFPFLAGIAVLIFPAYKGIWFGYLPVVGGWIAGLLVAKYLRTGTRGLAVSPPANAGVWLYVVPGIAQAGLLFLFRPVATFDGLFVFEHAKTLAASGVFDPLTYYPPMMAGYYSIWFRLFGASHIIAQLSHIPLSLAVTWLTVLLTRSISGHNRAGYWAGIWVAWYPGHFAYVLTTPYYHYLYTLFMMVMVFLACRSWPDEHETMLDNLSRRPRFIMLFCSGIFAALGALTKAVQLIAPAQIGVWLFLVFVLLALSPSADVSTTRRQAGRLFALWLIFCLGSVLALLPWIIRNYQVFGEFVPVCTSGGLVLYSANNSDSNGLYSAIPDQANISTPAEMLAHARWCSAQAQNWIWEEPVSFLKLVLIRFLHTWGSEATFTELINWRGEYRSWIKPGFSLVFLAGWSALVAAWCGRSWQSWSCRAAPGVYELLFGVIILSNAAIYAIFEGGDRHHLPMIGLIIAYIFCPDHREDQSRSC